MTEKEYTQEQLVDLKHQELMSTWYDSQDWGDDIFTQAMTEEVNPELATYRIKIFEAACYHAAQCIVYGT